MIRATKIYEVYPFLLDEQMGTPEQVKKMTYKDRRKMKEYVEYIVLTEHLKVSLFTEIPFVNEDGELDSMCIVFDEFNNVDELCHGNNIKNISLVSLN